MASAMAFLRKSVQTMQTARKSTQRVSKVFSGKYKFFTKQTKAISSRTIRAGLSAVPAKRMRTMQIRPVVHL